MGTWKQEYFWETAVELSCRLQAREFTALDCTRAFAERLEKEGQRQRMLALSLREEALIAAKAVDREIKRGRLRGPLQGAPFGVSDALSVANRPTTWGSPIFAGQVFPHDAAAVERARKAGAIAIAKLTSSELAGAGVFPPSATAADQALPAAVSGGYLAFALGLDSCGSMLAACAAQGVTALRPTYGTISLFGAMPGTWSLDSICIAGSSAEDCGHILAAVAGADPRHPASPGKRFAFAPQYSPPPGELRIGAIPAEFGGSAAEPARRGISAALDEFRKLGVKLVDIPAPELPWRETAEVIAAVEAASAFEDLVKGDRAGGLSNSRQAQALRDAADLKASDYVRAQRARRLVLEWTYRQLELSDVLAGPLTLPGTGQEERNSPGTGRPNAVVSAWLGIAAMAGLPVIVLPAGSAGERSGALVLTSRPRHANILLKLAMTFQNAVGWRRQPNRY